MASVDIGAEIAREIAAVALQREARRFATVVDEVQHGEASQDMLRARQRALEAAALEYAAAHGWQPPEASA
ncbi:MAG TPA: hypothetical protein VII06_43540 [Chloroflexota bacterium]|jgi:hypothetical protein